MASHDYYLALFKESKILKFLFVCGLWFAYFYAIDVIIIYLKLKT